MYYTSRFLLVKYQRNTHLLDIRLGTLDNHIRILNHVPIDSINLTFVRPSRFRQEYIVHPNGGNTVRMICTGCGAEYPTMREMSPCGFCAVAHETGIEVRSRGKIVAERVWTDHAYSIKQYVPAPQSLIGMTQRLVVTAENAMPVKFFSRHDAKKAVNKLAYGGEVVMYPYPVKR